MDPILMSGYEALVFIYGHCDAAARDCNELARGAEAKFQEVRRA